MPNKIAQQSYQKLLTQVRRLMQRGVVDAKLAIEQARVKTYWSMGSAIAAAISSGRFQKTHGDQLYVHLSKDLNLSYDVLSRIVHFYKLYPRLPAKNFTWSHYRCLIRVVDAKQRRALEKRIVAENLSSLALKSIVTALNTKKLPPIKGGGSKLQVQRGIPYLYRVSEINDIHKQKNQVEIDLGFHINVDKPIGTNTKLEKGILIRSKKTEQGYACIYSNKSREKLYTYVARIERVVDGDTLIAKIDCGFGVRTRQRLRLRGIDTPELRTIKGDKAKTYLKNLLKNVPFVIIKTYGAEKFGRYLADIFVLKGSDDPVAIAQEGVFVNQLLLDSGHAEIYHP